jgi:DNA-binding MarR family transcriptional regulator
MLERKSCETMRDKALYQLTNSLPYRLNRVGVRIGELFSERLKPFDATLPMYRVLAALWERPDQRLSDLSEMTTTEISTLSRLVGTMKRKGWVSRRRLEENGRTVAISLTTRGRTLTEELIPIAIHFEEVAIRNRTPEEVAWIKTALAEAYECLNELEAENIALRASQRSKRPPRGASPPRRKAGQLPHQAGAPGQ